MRTKVKKTSKKETFENVHKNYKLRYSHKAKLKNDSRLSGDKAYKDTTEEIQHLIDIAMKSNVSLRPFGSKWSLSKAPYSKDIMVEYSELKHKRFLTKTEVNGAFKKNKYLFTQSGNLIEDLNLFLFEKSRSLQTSGASNGQTIAGAIGTGVHGSAIHIGAIQDTVVGLHIVIDKNESVYLQAKNNKVATDTFIKKIGADKVIADDKLFHSALVSLGAFGFVHGVVIETVPLFLIKNYVTSISKQDAFKLSKTLNFKDSAFQIPGESRTPYHFKLYFNQYNLDGKDGIKAEIMYAYGPDRGFFRNILDYFKDIPKLLGKFTDAANCTIPALAKALSKFALPKNGLEVGHLNDIFARTKIRGSAFSTAFAVPAKDSVKVLELLLKEMKKSGKNVPSIFSFRFVKKSKATLAFTKHKMNCIIGLDGLQSKSTEAYLKLIHKALDKSGVPYAIHWGKVNNMDAAMVDRMYGSAKKTWIAQRNKLLSPEAKKVFSNAFTEKLGLT